MAEMIKDQMLEDEMERQSGDKLSKLIVAHQKVKTL